MSIPKRPIRAALPMLLAVAACAPQTLRPAAAEIAPRAEVERAASFSFAAAGDLPEPSAPQPLASESQGPEPNAALLDSCEAARSIVIHKQARRLELFCGDQLAARFETSLGFAPAGNKVVSGDGKTPEGEFYVTLKYQSKFHRSLQISYPGIVEAERGLKDGIITAAQHDAIVRAVHECRNPPQDTQLGSYVQIHGGGGGADDGDWTLGCVAVDNPEIEQVYEFHRAGCTSDGTPRTKGIIRP